MLLWLKSLYHLFLLLWCYTPEYTALCNCTLHFFRSFDCCCIDIMIGIFQSCFLCNCRDSHRIISWDNFKVNSLAVKKSQSIRCFLTYHVSDEKQSQRFKSCRAFRSFCLLFTVSQNKDTVSLLCVTATMFQKFFISFRKKELCSSHQISSSSFKNSTTVFPVWGERNGMDQFQVISWRKALSQRICCCILIMKNWHHISHNVVNFLKLLSFFLRYRFWIYCFLYLSVFLLCWYRNLRF